MSIDSNISQTTTPDVSFKNRRGGLIAFGIVQLMIAGLLILFAGFMLLIPASELAKSRPAGTPPPIVAAAVFYGILGILFAGLGIGSILAKNWARTGTLIVCWFWLVMGLLSLLFAALLMPSILQNTSHPQQTLPPNSAHSVLMVVLIFGGMFGVALPGIFLLFYHSKNVRATVLRGLPAPARKRPMLITILIAWFSFSSLSILFPLLTHYPLILFGVIVWGWSGKLLFVCSGLSYGFAAWAYARRDVRGWWLAMATQLFWVTSAAVSFLGRDLLDLYRQMGMTEQQLSIFKSSQRFLPVFITLMIIFMSLHVAAVIYSKRYFPVVVSVK